MASPMLATRFRSAAAVVCWALSASPFAATPARAQEFFPAPRDFVIEKACDAHRAIRSQTDPVPLQTGTAYPARGVNRKDGATHAFIRVGSDNKWVALSCGRFADGGEPAGAATGGAKTGDEAATLPQLDKGQCLPFFDDSPATVTVGVGGAVDISPPPPALDPFDRAVADVCGPPGKAVSRQEFAALFAAHPDVAQRLMAFTAGKVFADRPAHTVLDPYIADLTEAWFAIKAFDHIFCGEPSLTRGQIGGLHFHGRYLRLQQAGQACRMNNFSQNEVVPGVIYTMGVIMKNAAGNWVRDARKGYGLTLSAEDLLKVATRAFAENPTPAAESSGCLLPVSDDGRQFTSVFVRRSTGIRTFYPDATPNGRGGKQNPPCTAPIKLQP